LSDIGLQCKLNSSKNFHRINVAYRYGNVNRKPYQYSIIYLRSYKGSVEYWKLREKKNNKKKNTHRICSLRVAITYSMMNDIRSKGIKEEQGITGINNK
jgi:hypothetical protein